MLNNVQVEEDDEPWVDFDELPAIDRASVLALKVLVNRSLHYPENKSPNQEVRSHVKRLCSVIEHDGHLSSQLQARYVYSTCFHLHRQHNLNAVMLLAVVSVDICA
jgi:hypothetical protein